MANFCTLHSHHIPELQYKIQVSEANTRQMRIESNYEIGYPSAGYEDKPVGVKLHAKIDDQEGEISLRVVVVAYFTLADASLPEEESTPRIKAEAFPLVAGLLEDFIRGLAPLAEVDLFDNLSQGLGDVVRRSL